MTKSLHNDPQVISVRFNLYDVKRVLVDTDSSINILTLEVFNKLGLDKNNLVKVSYSLVGLEDKTVAFLGTINLPLVLRNEKYKWELYAEFAMVDISLTYNIILNRSVLNCHRIIINMGALYLKLLVLRGLAIVRGSQKSA